MIRPTAHNEEHKNVHCTAIHFIINEVTLAYSKNELQFNNFSVITLYIGLKLKGLEFQVNLITPQQCQIYKRTYTHRDAFDFAVQVYYYVKSLNNIYTKKNKTKSAAIQLALVTGEMRPVIAATYNSEM